MYLPASSASAAVHDAFTAAKPEIGGWSSLIGVVSAIIGNILISFALNTQRYAHLRLSRDNEAALQEKRRAAKRRSLPNYGTAEHTNGGGNGVQQSTKLEAGESALRHREDNGETRPLMSGCDSPSSSLDSSQQDEKDDDEPKEKSYLRSPIWWVGISLMVTGEIGNFLAYGFAPASIVSPLGVVALISNCLIAPLLLGEKFRWRDGLGVLIAVGGCVVVVLSASDSNPKLTPKAIWYLITRWEFETYLGVTCSLIVVLMLASNRYGDKTILIDIGLVGLFGGYTALSTKGVSSLLTYSVWKVVTFPITYLLVAVLVLTAVMQIKYINRALQRFNATMVIPTQFVMFTISVIVGSAVLYRDFERQKPEDGIKFGCGCALTFFGVWCITSGRKKDEDDHEDIDKDDESAYNVERVMSEIHEEDEESPHASTAAERSQEVPTMRRYHSDHIGSLPKSIVSVPKLNPPIGSPDVDTQPLTEQIHDMQPANASAVHVESAAPLLPLADSSKRPPLHATTSAPMPPSTPNPNNSLRPKTPLTRTPTGPPDSPARASPSRPPTGIAPRLLSRRSAVGLLPSALTSPLSGSLSAIVADELRRGIDRSPSSKGAMTRRRSARTSNQARRPTDEYSGGKPDLSRIRSGHNKRHSVAGGAVLEFEGEEASSGSNAGAMRPRPTTASSDVFSSGASTSNLNKQRTLSQQATQTLAPAFEEETARDT